MAVRRRPRLRIDIVTLFPGMFAGPLSESIVERARQRGILELGVTTPRDFTEDRHRTVDDRPYGGGAGMVLMAEPLYRTIRKLRRLRRGSKVILMSPQGRRFDQKLARGLSRQKHLILVCGHYEGIDERLMDFVDMELSIGDYVLTGGEIPAMAVADAVTRLLPGVLAKEEAAAQESFSEGLLDFPQYTRPRKWRGREVPEVLLGGDHARIAEWRRRAALGATRRKRPELVKK
ncbi:MAG: tRNA (guanosine(37)-N1)-methyltransferase TrmD [Elusimicrobiota bacterium]